MEIMENVVLEKWTKVVCPQNFEKGRLIIGAINNCEEISHIRSEGVKCNALSIPMTYKCQNLFPKMKSYFDL